MEKQVTNDSNVSSSSSQLSNDAAFVIRRANSLIRKQPSQRQWRYDDIMIFDGAQIRSPYISLRICPYQNNCTIVVLLEIHNPPYLNSCISHGHIQLPLRATTSSDMTLVSKPCLPYAPGPILLSAQQLQIK